MFNEVYDQLYKKNPDSLARKVNVAVPDPLHNKVTITENGEQDVVNYAVADIDIEGSGGGVSLDLHPKLTMNVTVHGQMDYGVDTQIVNNAFTVNGFFIIFKENHFFVPEFEDLNEDDYVTIGDGETKTVISYFPYNSGASFAIYVLIPKVGFLTNIQFSNNVNCTYSVSGDVYISDIDQDASIDVELTFQPND